MSAVNAWKTNREIRLSLICLFAFSGRELEAPPESLTPKEANFKKKLKEQLELDKKIDKVHRCFIVCVNDNHGIKEKNILTLLLPIGINSDDLDQLWLNSMNSFGKDRGIIAHTSASSYKTTQPINPKDELDNIKKIVYGEAGVQGLKDIDELLNALMK